MQNATVETEMERIEILESALTGLYEMVDRYAPREPPYGLRYLPANGGHGIERELRIAREVLGDRITQPKEEAIEDAKPLEASLAWALRWIEFCAEVPTGDEPDDMEQFQTAKALLATQPKED